MQLAASRFFLDVAHEPPWRTIWNYVERTEQEIDKALAKMEAQYAAREFTVDGEILHVLGLRPLLSDAGAIDKSRREVVEDGKEYIDDLYQSKKLHRKSDFGFPGFEGLGFAEAETAEFKELYKHLKLTSQRSFEDSYAERALDLLDEMKRDVQEFHRRISYLGTGAGGYVGIPVLAKLDPATFVDTMLALRPSEQHVAMMGLKARYEHGQLDRELSDERPWLEKIRGNLLARARSMKPMSRHRVQRFVDWYLKPVLQGEDEASDTEHGDKGKE